MGKKGTTRASTMARYEVLLDAAEQEGVALHPRDANERRQLARMALRGDLLRLAPGLYVRSAWYEVLGLEERQLCLARTYHLLHPNWVFCHFSAAAAYGLWVSEVQLEKVHVRYGPGSWEKNCGVVVRHKGSPSLKEWVNELPVTSLTRTVLDCIRESDFPRALAIADSALRIHGMAGDDLGDAMRREVAPRTRGLKRALAIVGLADARSESAGESMARARMMELGYRMPELQVSVPDPVELGRTYRVDFLWRLDDGSLVAGEYDGHGKYLDKELNGGQEAFDVLAEERRREARIAANDIRVLRMSGKELGSKVQLCRLLDAFGIPRDQPGINL